jgi:NAD(P)-dependent dehydrogenase (short-subunit alcohol dehydrogenase family)
MQPPYPAPVTEWHNDTYDAIHPTRPELSQVGRTVVITGAGQGIGREVVDAFAQAGASTIHVLGRTKETLEETKDIVEKSNPNVNVILHVADVVNEPAVKEVAKKVGSWDVIVANAGYIPKPDLIENSNADEWWKTFEVRLLLQHFIQDADLSFDRSTLKAATCSLVHFFHTRRAVVQLLLTQVVLHSCLLHFPFFNNTRHILPRKWELLASMSSWLWSTQI